MKLSIITINRNNAIGLEQTIKSVISLKYSNFEYIVIDGASTDNSIDIIRKYASSITFWISEPDKGIYNAMIKRSILLPENIYSFLIQGTFLRTVVLLIL